MRSPKTLFVRLGIIFLSATLALAAGEVALRYWFHALPQLELDLYQRDVTGNLRLRPSIERRHVTRLWDVHIRLNSEGWRDREPSPDEIAPIVLGLGDSMAFGWGIELEQSYLFLLEQRLKQQQPVRLIKAAVPGTGPGDQLQLLGTLWTRYQPRAVILSFFVGNDFVDVQMGGASQFEVEDGLLVRRALAGESASWLSAVRSRIVRTSRVLQLLRALQLNWMRPGAAAPENATTSAPRHWDEWLREFAQIHRKEYPERTQKAVENTLQALDAMADLCRAHNAPLILVIIPRSVQIDEHEKQEMLTALNLSKGGLDLDRPQRLLTEWAAKQSVPAVDLLPLFRQAHQQDPSLHLYHYPDAHMNASGHRLAAQAIEENAGAMEAITNSLTSAATTQ